MVRRSSVRLMGRRNRQPARRRVFVPLGRPSTRLSAIDANAFTMNLLAANAEIPYGDMVEDATNLVRESEARPIPCDRQ